MLLVPRPKNDRANVRKTALMPYDATLMPTVGPSLQRAISDAHAADWDDAGLSAAAAHCGRFEAWITSQPVVVQVHAGEDVGSGYRGGKQGEKEAEEDCDCSEERAISDCECWSDDDDEDEDDKEEFAKLERAEADALAAAVAEAAEAAAADAFRDLDDIPYTDWPPFPLAVWTRAAQVDSMPADEAAGGSNPWEAAPWWTAPLTPHIESLNYLSESLKKRTYPTPKRWKPPEGWLEEAHGVPPEFFGFPSWSSQLRQ